MYPYPDKTLHIANITLCSVSSMISYDRILRLPLYLTFPQAEITKSTISGNGVTISRGMKLTSVRAQDRGRRCHAGGAGMTGTDVQREWRCK